MADRELDAQVAEKVMGVPWKRFAPHMIRAGSTYGRMLYCIDDEFNRDHLELASLGDPLYQPKIDKPTGQEWMTTVPRYSSDISAAMKVVEKMRENGFVVLTRCVNKWYVEFSPRTTNPDQDFGRAQQESLSRAICEAALKAIKASE